MRKIKYLGERERGVRVRVKRYMPRVCTSVLSFIYICHDIMTSLPEFASLLHTCIKPNHCMLYLVTSFTDYVYECKHKNRTNTKVHYSHYIVTKDHY